MWRRGNQGRSALVASLAAQLGAVRHNSARLGTVRRSLAQFGTARHSLAQFGTVRHSSAQLGSRFRCTRPAVLEVRLVKQTGPESCLQVRYALLLSGPH